MTRKVIKSKGKFQIVPTSAEVARKRAIQDKTKSEEPISQAELHGIIHRILERLDALENR